MSVFAGLLLIAPLWLVAKEYIVYGITSLALLFGMLHVRNFPGAFISAMFYGLVFIWSRNIWYSVALHAGSNLATTLLAVYCWLQLGDMQMSSIPVIILPDMKVIIASLLLALAGVLLLNLNRKDTGR
jgi:membrane protease YdiL (CAAX protease family)